MNKYELKPDPYYPIKEDFYGTLERYLNHGITGGSFTMAVLENNLMEACARADHENIRNLHNIVGYIYNHVPCNAWGSREKVTQFLESFNKENTDEL